MAFLSCRMSKFKAVLFWSVLAAAFIGPGTVTTAAKVGAGFQLDLLWALVFSLLATLLLQEAAARISIGAGQPLGALLGKRYHTNGRRIAWLLFGAIALGCGAYQMGNLLGAFAGLELLGFRAKGWLLVMGAIAAIVLASGSIQLITRVLAVIVAAMGIVFCWVALGADLSWLAALQGMQPKVTDSNALLIVGLIGTTIVPYNLFLASGISQGQQLGEMRWGVAGAVILGGIITFAIMCTGTQVQGEFSFNSLATALEQRLGPNGGPLLSIGLLAAGFSSAVTAPLAAAVAGQSLLGQNDDRWSGTGRYFRITWGIILGSGLLFALTDVKPIPAIIAAQAVNGIILPLVASFLLLAVNDAQMLPKQYHNPQWLNLATLLVVGITVFLGLNNLWAATQKALGWQAGTSYKWWVLLSTSLLLMGFIARHLWRRNSRITL